MNTKPLTKYKLIAPCGMNCSICIAYLRENNKCPGCRGSDVGKPITRLKCKIKTCNNLSSKFCYDCKDFPCDKLNHLDIRYQTKYNMSMIENLESIRKIGLRTFIAKEKIRWTCSSCGGTICVHKGHCYSCLKIK